MEDEPNLRRLVMKKAAGKTMMKKSAGTTMIKKLSFRGHIISTG